MNKTNQNHRAAHTSNTNSSKRGLANLSMKQRKEIAKMGGIAAHRKGTAHEFTRREAKIAGKKGGSLKKKNIKK